MCVDIYSQLKKGCPFKNLKPQTRLSLKEINFVSINRLHSMHQQKYIVYMHFYF